MQTDTLDFGPAELRIPDEIAAKVVNPNLCADEDSFHAALAWMRQVFCYFERGDARPPLPHVNGAAPDTLRLHIFEDSPAGMRGGLAAVDLLQALGLPAQIHLWGVSEHAEKAAALRATEKAKEPAE